MTYDFKTLLLNRAGAVMKDGTVEVTIGDVCIKALDAVDEMKRVEGAEKYRRAILADRIYRAKEPIRLEVEEVKLVKDMVGTYILGPLIVKRAWDFLDSPIQDSPKGSTLIIPTDSKQ